MKDELTGIVEALKYSMQMEVDGKKFYTLTCTSSDNQVGKELFAWLAEQENYHLQRFQEIYKSIMEKKGWPVEKVRLNKHAAFRTIFADAIGSASKSAKPAKGDLPAADKAIEMEIKSRDYYTERAVKSSSNEEKTFFTAVATEEQGHYLALVDYKEYVTDPVGFFTRTERHSIDGE
jgi:rubrerythrin